MKKRLRLISAISALVMAFQFSTFAKYPEHPEKVALSETNNTKVLGANEADATRIFEVDGKKFILLDTDDEGNYFVLTNEMYGQHAFDTTYSKAAFTIETATENENGMISYEKGDIDDLDESKVLFSTTDEDNIGYWLNNDFLTNGNGTNNKLPSAIQENLIEAEWKLEGRDSAIVGWQTKSYYDNLKGDTTGQSFAATRSIAPYSVRGKVALMSYTEFNNYKELIGGKPLAQNSWRGWMLRTAMSQTGGVSQKNTNGENIPKTCLYTWGNAIVKWSGDTLMVAYSSKGYTNNDTLLVRPCFWLDKDFFKKVKVNVDSLGSVPKEKVMENSNDELTQIGYTIADIMKLNGRTMSWDWGNYPSHATASTNIGEDKVVSGGVVGNSPEENLFTIGGRRFILLDRNLNGEYFVLADEEYGNGNMMSGTQVSAINEKRGSETGWEISDWLYNPTITNSLEWKLNDSSWGVLTGNPQYSFGYEAAYNGDKERKVIPEEMLDDILLKEWEIEPISPIKGWKYNSYANEEAKKAGQAWLDKMAASAKTEKVSAKLILMSAKEYDAYKSKIGFSSGMTGSAAYARNLLRTSSAQLSGNQSTGAWSLGLGYLQVGLSSAQTDVRYSQASLTDNKYMIRPCFWLAKDFFKNNRIDVKTAGDTIFTEMRDLYSAADLAGVYTDDEISVIMGVDKVAVLDFALTDVNGNEFEEGAASSTDGNVYLKAYLDNVTDESANVMLAVARYNGNKLEKIDSKVLPLAAGDILEIGTEKDSISVEAKDDLEVSYKIFAWNSDTMAPYKNAKTYYSGKETEVLYNNAVYQFGKQPAVEIDTKVYVPIKKLAQSAGYSVKSENENMTITGNGDTVVLTAGSDEMTKNGASVIIDVPPVARFDDLMVSVKTLKLVLSNIDEDVTLNDDGIALHKKYYDEDATFFNLNTSFSGDPKTERGFSWEAVPAYDNMVIEYGVTGGEVTQVKADYKKCSVVYNYNVNYADENEMSFYDDMLFYQIGLKNLTPGTKYSYRIGDIKKDIWSDWYNFETEAENTNEFSVITVTDSQAYSEATFASYKKTLDAAKNDCEKPSFLIHLGDITENGTCDDWWNMHFNASADMCESLPTIAVFGNHESRGIGAKYFNLHYLNPSNGHGLAKDFDYSKVSKYEKAVVENLDNTVYSFDYGDVHFAVLNSGCDWGNKDQITDLQKEWLKADMAATNKKWKVVLIHIAIYRSGEPLDKSTHSLYSLMDECDIDFVMQGHDHIMLRTKPMKNDVPYDNSLNPNVINSDNGIVYDIMGCSGYHKSGDTLPEIDYIEVVKGITLGNPNYSIVTFNSDEIKVVTKTIDGNIMDEFKIIK